MFRPTRRRAMGLIGGAVAGATATSRAATAATGPNYREVASLGALAAARGVLFGTAFDVGIIDTPRQAHLYRHHARILVPDGSMKFWSLRPEETKVRYGNADRALAWADAAGIPMRGHCLIWNDQNPPWVAGLSAMRRRYWLDRHVEEVVGRYAGRLHSWDVVNEPFYPGHGKPGGFRDGPWLDAMGPDYIVRAVKRARAADPKGRIVINESGPEWENPWGSPEPYRQGLLSLIDRIRDAGVTVDAVGLQCHWFRTFNFDPARFREYLHQLSARVAEVYITELDINDGAFVGPIEQRDAKVADRYVQIVSAALAEPVVKAILVWHLFDSASWLVQDPYHWADPGRPPRPLPFDREYRPKAAYHALAKLFGSRGNAPPPPRH